MKRRVNGAEVELQTPEIRAERLGDRWIVHTSEGSFSAVTVRHRDTVLVSYAGRLYEIEPIRAQRGGSAAASGELRAQMPGLVVEVFVKEGDTVRAGEKLLVIEAMKTQQPFTAPFDGVVASLSASAGQQVADGAPLAMIVPHAQDETEAPA